MIPNTSPHTPVYRLRRFEVEKRLRTSVEKGLSTSEVKRRQQEYGHNDLTQSDSTAWRSVLVFSANAFGFVLIGAALLSWTVQKPVDAVAFILVAFVLVVCGIIYTLRSRHERNTEHVARVVEIIRDGAPSVISVRELVPGDVCILRSGKKIPADIRLMNVRSLRMNESLLTGKPVEVEKIPTALPAETGIGDQRNMVFAGTSVVSGSGQGIVVSTGKDTVLGKISHCMERTETRHISLYDRLHTIGSLYAGGIVVICGLVFGAGVLTGTPVEEMYALIVVLAISAVPVGVYIVPPVILGIASHRLASFGSMVRQWGVIETVGALSSVCLDKTGTLTTGRLALKRIMGIEKTWSLRDGGRDVIDAVAKEEPLQLMFAGMLCASGTVRDAVQSALPAGLAIESALVHVARNASVNIKTLRETYPLRDTITFSARKKYSASLHDDGPRRGKIAFVVGAPDVLLPLCSRVHTVDDEMHVLGDDARQHLLGRVYDTALEGKRLLAIAFRRFPAEKRAVREDDMQELVFVGVLVFEDTVRGDARVSVNAIQDAGVRVILVTGDHCGTAERMARDIGLQGHSMHGCEIVSLGEERLGKLLPMLSVVARCDPVQRDRIAHMLQRQGEVVGVAGDSADDMMALKRADVGIAVGLATDAVKKTADLMVLGGGVGMLSTVITECKRVREAVRNVISYTLSTNIAEVLIIAGALLLHMPVPFVPAMIVWVNGLTDGLIGVALGMERHAPRKTRESVKRDTVLTMLSGVALLLPVFVAFAWALHDSGDVAVARTVAFVVLVGAKIFAGYSFRSSDRFSVALHPFRNMWLWGVMAGLACLLVLAVVWEPLQLLLSTVPLTPAQWGVAMSAAVIGAGFVEARKLLRPKWMI